MAANLRKEQTYGWYPAVRDIYLSKNQPIPYHLECLYKFKESGYYNPKVEPPESSFHIGILTPAPPSSRPCSATPKTGSSRASSARRAKSVPVPRFTPVPTLHVPTPAQCWSARLAETSYGLFDPNSFSASLTPDSAGKGSSASGTEGKRVSGVFWPAQRIVSKYDQPYEPERAASVFSEPLPTPEPSNGGYVFVPDGDGTCQVYSPPVVWPASSPVPPTPPRAASSRATIGSVEGADMRQQQWQQYTQQQERQQQERQEKQQRFEQHVKELEHHQQAQQQQSPQPEPPKSAPGVAARRPRVQSACSVRSKPPIPQRPIQSAGPTRPPTQGERHHFYSQQRRAAEVRSTKTKPEHKAIKSKVRTKPAKTSEPEQTKITVTSWDDRKAPAEAEPPAVNVRPPTASTRQFPALEDLMAEETRTRSPERADVITKYGWRAEVHGDPYNLKKVTERKPYYVKCDEPEIPPEPPGVHMENLETFFLNTIPRQKAAFDVHQEWISEAIHAKRMELQKREGFRTRWKNFAFAY